MAKIKIFDDTDRHNLEQIVNNFIWNKHVINVSFSQRELRYQYRYFCCVCYEDCYPT